MVCLAFPLLHSQANQNLPIIPTIIMPTMYAKNKIQQGMSVHDLKNKILGVLDIINCAASLYFF